MIGIKAIRSAAIVGFILVTTISLAHYGFVVFRLYVRRWNFHRAQRHAASSGSPVQANAPPANIGRRFPYISAAVLLGAGVLTSMTVGLRAAMHHAIVAAAIVAYIAITLVSFNFVHFGLAYCYYLYARRFCRRNGFRIKRYRYGPQFDKTGIKTEFTIFELDCLDGQSQRKLVWLLICIFGIRAVRVDDFPEPTLEEA